MDASTAMWLGAVGIALGLGIRAGRFWARVERSYRTRRRQAAALRGERDAEQLLKALGYRVLERQARAPYTVVMDGDDVHVEVRADYLVSRDGRHYVAEVKTGESAPSPRTGSTRRQLLEYSLVYAVDGTLLVDMQAGQVHEVQFPALRQPAPRTSALTIGLLWATAGAVAALWIARSI